MVTVPIPTGDADDEVTAWLCTHLPILTGQPGYPRWAHKLDAALTAIRTGTPTVQALADHGIPVDITAVRSEQKAITRGDPAILDELGVPEVAVTGDYTCPAADPSRRCPRRAGPDPDGHQPRCGVHAHTMILRQD